MIDLLRYAGIVLGALVVALVFMTCADGACGACAGVTCSRAEARLARPSSTLSRMFAMLGVDVTSGRAPSAAPPAAFGAGFLRPHTQATPIQADVLPLRI